VYPPHLVEWAFRANGRDRVCRLCEQTARNESKERDRWKVKAQDVVRRHATRLGIDRNELVTRYGWDPQLIARDAERHYAIGCNYCPRDYAGPADVTLDILNRNIGPYYCTNTKWCCQGCNRDKGVMTPEEFEAMRQIRVLWMQSKHDLPEQLMLFEAG
jgi:hypothetical protein